MILHKPININTDGQSANVISVAATHISNIIRFLSNDVIHTIELIINLEHRDVSKYPKRVKANWLMLRRHDPDSPVLSRAIGKLFKRPKEKWMRREKKLSFVQLSSRVVRRL